MGLSLIRDKITGLYQTVQQSQPTNPVIDTSGYEAYTSNQKTSLATGQTDLGLQTESILQRDTGGTLSYDPTTQSFKRTGEKESNIGVSNITDISSEGQQTTPGETPFDKVARITAMTPMGTGTSGIDQSQIDRALALQEKQQRMGSLMQTADLGLKAYRTFKGISGGGLSIPGTTGPITPLTGGSFGGSTFMSGAGGAAVAGGLGYGVSKVLGGSAKQNRAAGVGSAVGMAVGGPVGGAVGGVIGRVIGCFLPNTLISMADGSKKKIIDIELKDDIAIGGFVFATGKFLVNDIYDYKNIKVSGSHLVNENGNWLKVEDSKLAKLISTEDTVVYTLGTKNRRILINDTLFTDYFDIDEQQKMAS